MIALTVAASFYALYLVARATYYVFLHPLSCYPGSKVAAASNSWYEWYWNYYKHGKMVFEIERLHSLHGPVVRIGPNDISVNDPEVYLEMTRINSGFRKEPKFYQCISFPGTSIGETDPAKHLIRRKVLTPAFSGSRVQELAPGILFKVQRFLAKLDDYVDSSQTICLTAACHALTMDIISKIVLGQEMGSIERPDFRNEFMDYLNDAFAAGWIATAFPRIASAALWLSSSTTTRIFPNPLVSFKQKCLEITKEYVRWNDKEISVQNHKFVSPKTTKSAPTLERSAVLEMLLDPAAAQGHTPLGLQDLNDEVVMLLTAGNDTTSNAMIFGIHSIYANRIVYNTLFKELEESFPDATHWVTYEEAKRLPYLAATIKEVLRLGNPLPGRLPRLIPYKGFSLYGKALPPQTSVHMIPYLLNRHPGVWEQPERFEPKRWMQNGSRDLEKYLATFNRGSRQCLGKDLAWCELSVLFANLVRRYDIEITRNNMEWSDLILLTYKENLVARIHRKAQ